MAHLAWENDAGHTIAVKFDAVRTVEHRQHAAATKHPIQKGADVSDHVRVDLPSVSVTGYISRLPLNITSKIGERTDKVETIGEYRRIELPRGPAGAGGIAAAASALQGGFVQAGLDALKGIGSPDSVESLVITEVGSRVRQMEDILIEAQNKKRLVRFIDEARDYENMVIASVSCTRTQQVYGAVFQVELEGIRVVSSKLVDVPLPLEVRGELAKAAGAGTALPSANADKKKEQAVSDAAKLYDFGRKALGF